MEAEMFIPIFVVAVLFIGLPWIIFHYITKWKSAATLTAEDENLLDELHELARRLDDRICSIERIMSAENPNWRSIACDPADLRLSGESIDDRSERLLQVGRSNRPQRRS